jgi:hypothetical protein
MGRWQDDAEIQEELENLDFWADIAQLETDLINEGYEIAWWTWIGDPNLNDVEHERPVRSYILRNGSDRELICWMTCKQPIAQGCYFVMRTRQYPYGGDTYTMDWKHACCKDCVIKSWGGKFNISFRDGTPINEHPGILEKLSCSGLPCDIKHITLDLREW